MENILERPTPKKVTSVLSTIIVLILMPLLLLGVYNTIQVITRALGKPANISINTTRQLQPISTDYMLSFAQGGEEPTDMIAPVINEIRNLNPKFVRIDHIYDYYQVVSKSDQELLFDFAQLDQVVNSIITTGATPVLALSYMPTAIAREGSVTNPPENWDDWALVVQKTIEQYSGKNGKNLSNIYYEVWNEPDLPQFGQWTIGGDKDYLNLYRYASLGAMKAINTNQFFLGGPATTGLYKNWIMAIVNSGSRVDFLSWHSYLADPKQFAIDQQNIAEWLNTSPRFALMPKLITEYGFSGTKDNRYNTRYAAAYTAAVFRRTVVGSPKGLFSFQIKDGPNQDSGWGIIGHESLGKIKKPRFSVFPLIENMRGTRLELTGEGSWVSALATTRDGVIRVMLINFNHENDKSETVPVAFTNLTPGNYTYREIFPEERDIQFKEVVNETTLVKQIYLPANTVAVIELTKIDQPSIPSLSP